MTNQPATVPGRASHDPFMARLIRQAQRVSAPDFDPTCVLCEFGEEPGHEH